MNKLALIVLSGGWFGLVYLGAAWWTFPGEAAADRLAYEVEQRSKGEYRVQADALRPWWFGARGTKVKLFQRDQGELALVGIFERVAARVSPFSLLSRQPYVVGRVELGDGVVDIAVQTVLDEEGVLVVSDVDIAGIKLPLEQLPLPGVLLEGLGTLDTVLDVQAPDGLRQANGRASLSGRNLVITSITLPGQGDLVKMLDTFAKISEVLIEELDIDFDITEGKASVRRGSLRTNVASVDLSGDITLSDSLMRSVLKLEAAITLDESLQRVAGMLGAAGPDGKHRYEITGTIGRPSFGQARERGASRLRGLGASIPVPIRDGEDPDDAGDGRRALPRTLPGATITGGASGAGSVPDDPAARSEEIRERLRLRREQRGLTGQPVRPSRGAQRVEVNDEEPPVDLYIEPEEEGAEYEPIPLDDEAFEE